MSDPLSDSLKPRPDQRPSDKRFPTPWTMEEGTGGSALIVDREKDFVASASRSEYWIKRAAMPFIVHRVNSFDSLLEALKLLYKENADYIRINNLGDVHHNRSMKLAKAAIESAEKQP